MRSHALLMLATLGACKGTSTEYPRVPAASPVTIAATHDGHSLRGVAGDGTNVFAAFAGTSASLVEARASERTVWSQPVDGTAGELAVAGTQLVVASSLSSPALRGDPAARLHAFDRESGAPAWQRPLESTEWVLVTSIAALDSDVIVAGSFAGTLRIADKVVTSGGGSDGFVARITARGALAWLVRLGGTFADGVQGVAVSGSGKAARIAIAGTFSLTAELQGTPLPAIDERTGYTDAFVAELDGGGKRRWSATFGSRAADSVAGVAIDREGRVVVAANVQEVLSAGGVALVPRGMGDGLVVWYGPSGELGTSVLVGGNDFDGIRAITTVNEHVIIGGFFSGSLQLGDRTFTAGGGDDAFAAALDPNGTVASAWHLGGAGREEVTSLAALPGGFIVGVAHTADAAIDGSRFAAPPAGGTGAVLAVRGY